MSETSLTILVFVLIAAWLALGMMTAGHAIMFKRDPKGAALWVIVSFTIPLAGPWFYWGFGINRVQRRAMKRLGGLHRPIGAPPQPGLRDRLDPSVEVTNELRGLRTLADRVTHLPLTSGNTITPLHNGEKAYPEMIRAIVSAEHSVTLASYIFDWDEVGREFAHALADAAQRNVRVHVLLDGLGAVRTFSRMGRFLIRSGAHVAPFFPLRVPFGRVRINLRNHRKILVVDGRTGFTGGMNVSQRHLVTLQKPGRVEGLHFKITGPVVAQMQHTFVEDWTLAAKETLEGEDYYPTLQGTGPALCRGISSGPDEHLDRIHWIMQAAFATAQRTVQVVTPYFVPSLALVSSMSMAAMRGVDVTLMLPSVVDRPYMRWAADAYLWELLGNGVRVFRRPPPFAHTKLIVVDDRWLLLGSANLDRRSFRLNFEFNVEAYDADLAAGLGAWLDGQVRTCEQVTLEGIDARPRMRRLRDGVAKLFSPYL